MIPYLRPSRISRKKTFRWFLHRIQSYINSYLISARVSSSIHINSLWSHDFIIDELPKSYKFRLGLIINQNPPGPIQSLLTREEKPWMTSAVYWSIFNRTHSPSRVLAKPWMDCRTNNRTLDSSRIHLSRSRNPGWI